MRSIVFTAAAIADAFYSFPMQSYHGDVMIAQKFKQDKYVLYLCMYVQYVCLSHTHTFVHANICMCACM